MKLNKKILKNLLLQLFLVACVVLLYTGCTNSKKMSDSEKDSKQNSINEVSMEPTASDEDPAWVYFTADSSGYNYTFRIKSNGTGLEKLYESKAGPIWISPDNKYVYIKDQVKISREQKDPFCPRGITIWDIEKKEKKVLPFYDEPTWGSGWYDNENILYSKYFYTSKRCEGLFKQNIHSGDTSIIFYWDKRTALNAVYNKKDDCFYYINDDSLYIFKGKRQKYRTYAVEYSFSQFNTGQVSLTNEDSALMYYYIDSNSQWKYVVIDLKGKILNVIDESIDPDCSISWVKFDLKGKWVYYACGMHAKEPSLDLIKRKKLESNEKPEVIKITKTDEMSIGYIALGYDH